MGFPGGSVSKESACRAEDLGSMSGLGRFPWERARQPIPVFLPGGFPGTEDPYSPWGCKELGMTVKLSTYIHTESANEICLTSFTMIKEDVQEKQCSVQLSNSFVSDSLWPHGLQHTRPPCPLPAWRAWSNSCPSSQCCHTTISSSVVPFSSCLQSFPTSGSFQMSQFFTPGGQRIGISGSAWSFQGIFRVISFRIH